AAVVEEACVQKGLREALAFVAHEGAAALDALQPSFLDQRADGALHRAEAEWRQLREFLLGRQPAVPAPQAIFHGMQQSLAELSVLGRLGRGPPQVAFERRLHGRHGKLLRLDNYIVTLLYSFSEETQYDRTAAGPAHPRPGDGGGGAARLDLAGRPG